MVKKGTVGLVIVFLAFLLGAYFLNRSEPESKATATPPPTPKLLFSIEASDLERITIEDDREERVTLEKSEGEVWMMVVPEEGEADTAKISMVISSFVSMQALREFDVDLDLAVIGLAPPKYTIALKTAGEEVVVLIGIKSPTGSGVYASVNGGPPILAPKFNISTLSGWISSPPFAPTPTPAADG